MKKYLDLLHTLGAAEALVISAADIVVADWTIMKCLYGCPTYGHNRCCPPYAPGADRMRRILAEYTTAIIFSCPRMEAVTPAALAAAKALAADGRYKALAFGAGPCHLCHKCTPDACPRPADTAPSPEACGIDVIATARRAGIPIHIPPRPSAPLTCIGLLLVE